MDCSWRSETVSRFLKTYMLHINFKKFCKKKRGCFSEHASPQIYIRFSSDKHDIFSYLYFFHKHSRFTVHQGKWEAISLTPLYHFHPVYRHKDIRRVTAAKSSPLHIASSRTRPEKLWFPSTSC